MEQTLTHHFIDDQAQPDIDGIEPWDQAMSVMRRESHFPPGRLLVSDDGKLMTIDMTGARLGDNYTRMAEIVRDLFQLPLEVLRHRKELGGICYYDMLYITYKPQ